MNNKIVLKVNGVPGHYTIPINKIYQLTIDEYVEGYYVELHYFNNGYKSYGHKGIHFSKDAPYNIIGRNVVEVHLDNKVYLTFEDFKRLKITLDYHNTIAALEQLE